MALFSDADRLRWVYTGQKVTADVGKGRGLRCVVVTAAGDMALIRAEDPDGPRGDFQKWYNVSDLFPELPDFINVKAN